MPRVTVITATYNWAPVLPHAMASVLEQTFPDLELWVVGDGCTDESEAVVAAVDDPRVHWHNLPANTGHQSGPNNAGLERASGELVAGIVTNIANQCGLTFAATGGLTQQAQSAGCSGVAIAYADLIATSTASVTYAGTMTGSSPSANYVAVVALK